MADPFSLAGQTALITGGGTGIGYGIARCFVAAGARVILVGRRAQVIENAVAELGSKATGETWDITRMEDLPGLVERVRCRAGPISILVNNAGNYLKKSAVETTPADFDSILHTHLVAAFELSRIVATEMINRDGGSILFVASMASFLAIPLVSAYSAAKCGVVGLTRSLASEFSPHGVRVNAVAPGWIETSLLQQALNSDPGRRQKILNRTPLAKLGAISDVGWASVYLCSNAARFVTGVVLPIDGGASVGF